MPGRLERHRRSKWEWGAPGSRSAEVRDAVQADPEPARKAPGKKNTKRWCRGKPGVEHRVVIVRLRPGQCGWVDTGHWVHTGPVLPKGVPVPKRFRHQHRKWVVTGRQWFCLHERRCLVCQKDLGPAAQCPDREVAREPQRQQQ